MDQHANTPRRAKGRALLPRALPWALAAGAVAQPGCYVWDQLTSRDFRVAHVFQEPWAIDVLRDSPDGDRRAKALRALGNADKYADTPANRELVLKILAAAAAKEKQALCRMAAMEAMASYQDPRLAEALADAYYNAGTFPPEVATAVRCQALAALGQTGDPAAVELLAKVVGEPPVEGPEEDRQQKDDERMAAARALAHFRHYRGVDALVGVLKKDKDVALRGCAHASLVRVTGRDLPPEAEAWEQFLQHNPKRFADDPPFADRLLDVVNVSHWFK